VLQNYFIKDVEPAKLKPFVKSCDNENAIPFTQKDYLQLVDWTGRAVIDAKKGAIPQNYPPILNRLGINEDKWLDSVNHYGSTFHECVGHLGALKNIALKTERQWLKGCVNAFQLFRKESYECVSYLDAIKI